MKLKILFILFFIINSCGVKTVTEKNVYNKITINDMIQIPEDIEGCSCYLSRNNNSFNNQKFIFASNNDSICYMMINNELTRFKMKNTTRDPFTFKNHDLKEYYSSENYELEINSHFEDSTSYESWNFSGEIYVKSINGEETKIKFVGTCGC